MDGADMDAGETGAMIDAEDADGNTALTRAAEKGDSAQVEALLDGGADVDYRDTNRDDNKTVLMLAVMSGSTLVVDILLRRGVDISAEDLYGDSALTLAVEGGFYDLAQSLLNHARGVELHGEKAAHTEMEVEIQPTETETDTAVAASGSSAAAPDSGTGAASSPMASLVAGATAGRARRLPWWGRPALVVGAPPEGPAPLRRPPWEKVKQYSCCFSLSAPDDVVAFMLEDYYEPSGYQEYVHPRLAHAVKESIGSCALCDMDKLRYVLRHVGSVVRVMLGVLSESPEGATHMATVAKQPSFLASVAEKLKVDSANLHFVDQPVTAMRLVEAPPSPPLQRLLRGQRSEVEILDLTFPDVDLADHALPERRTAWRASWEAEARRVAAAVKSAFWEQRVVERKAGAVSTERLRAFAARERARGSGQRLRFAPGDRVRCMQLAPSPGGEFAPYGRVTQLRPVGAGQGAPYQVLLDDGRYVYPREDNDDCIVNAVGLQPREREAIDRCFMAGYQAGRAGRTVLTAEEVEALLSDGGLELLRDVAETFNIANGRERLLRGFVVRRRAALLLAGEPLYAPARIIGVVGRDAGVHPSQARLNLNVDIDGTVRRELGVPLWRLSNAIGEKELRLRPGPADGTLLDNDTARALDRETVCKVARALSCGDGAARLDQLVVWPSVPLGVAAIDKWRELLMRAGVCEDEPKAGEKRRVIIGEWSSHAILYSRLHGAHEALVEFLTEITDPEMENAEVWQRWLVKRYDEWPLERRGVAVEWLRWLLRPDARRAGFPALCGFVAHENGLSPEQHIARDDAGRYSLARAARDGLIGCLHELVADGKMESLPGTHSPGCAICSRAVRSCARWAQLQPCRHWLVDLDAHIPGTPPWHECSRRICADCRERWMLIDDGDESPEEGVEVEDGLWPGDGVTSSPQVCPLCRAEVIKWCMLRVTVT